LLRDLRATRSACASAVMLALGGTQVIGGTLMYSVDAREMVSSSSALGVSPSYIGDVHSVKTQ